ncbi:MAG: hypothetical protein V7K41_04795 [Nostoc sp.]
MDIDGKLESYRENKFPNLYHTEYSVTSNQVHHIIVLLGLRVRMIAGGVQ